MDKTESSPGACFQRERIVDFWDEAYPLALKNVEETGALGPIEFNPDKERYEKLEEAGLLFCFTARLSGKLIGYAFFYIHQHSMYNGSWALQDVLYFAKEHRGFASAKFLLWQEQELKSLGADYSLRQVNRAADYSRTLERMGYENLETTFIKRF